MATCKICGRDFHACSSCGLSNGWEYEYCCEEHWEESKEYQQWRTKFRALFKTINSPQQKFLVELLTELPSDFENKISLWVNEIKESQND